ncbi:RNA-binding protein 6 isoform X2 [Trichomycterus rosablanca]|uniref:RNA-binding protein 6 isoform X2 n=1 Tax=Trichomycterus rosablanca TaxID=2290929 RepID=UPI002F35D19A
MWNGSRSGPRGGMPFRGGPRGEMFEERNGLMSGFRGRDGLNMGAGPPDRSPMDMRRFDHPPDMMGRSMGLLERGRDPRDLFGPRDKPDLNFRRNFDMEQNAPGFMGHGRHPMAMGDRDMHPRDMRRPEDQHMDMRERDRYPMDRFDMSPMDIRRRLAMESMNRNDHIREREMSQKGFNDLDGFNMDMPSRERSVMDFERRGCAPLLNPRGRFESDVDFRNRMGSPGDFRDRPPQMFGNRDETTLNIRGRPDVPADRQGPEKVGGMTLRDREFPDQTESPSRLRDDAGKPLSEEWSRHSMREQGALSPMINRRSSSPQEIKDRLMPLLGRDTKFSDPPQFQDRERQSLEFSDKSRGSFDFSRSEREGPAVPNWKNVPTDFPGRDVPRSIQKQPLLPLPSTVNTPSRGRDGLSNRVNNFSVDQGTFKGKDNALDDVSKKGNLTSEPRDSDKGGSQDQDYRDIDYRTSSGHKYEYILDKLEELKEPNLSLLERPNSSGSQDQDYRSAAIQEKISNTIVISGIPKTATMQQILDAFAVREGVPMQGMKIRDVVPGYSSDTAYVEFLNLEDAVHFMESNQGVVKVGSKTAQLKYVQPARNAKEDQDLPPKAAPSTQDGLLPCPDLLGIPTVNVEGINRPLTEPHLQGEWQRSSTLTPEAWQQQVDKQLQQQQQTEKQGEEWANWSGSRQSQQSSDTAVNESRTMIIKNILPNTTLETILKALDALAYLDERNVRLVKGKTPGSKCFCFVDMDSHQQVLKLVELLTVPRPILIDGVRVFAEVAKPLKNQNYWKDHDKSNTSLLGYPPDVMEQNYPQQSDSTIGFSTTMQGMCPSSAAAESSLASAALQSPASTAGVVYSETPAVVTTHQPASVPNPALPGSTDGSEAYYSMDNPDLSAFLYDATSGFYYDPQTTLYYDPNSRYFYNAETQQYLYWDSVSKTYVPVENSSAETPAPSAPVETVAEAAPVEDQKLLPADVPEQREDEDATSRSDKKEKEKEEKPKTLAAFKIMKDMERWAKIQNRQKESVRSPSPVLKSGSDEKKGSKAADVAFAVFERKATGGDDLFKKPLAPPKKEEKGSKKPIGSLGMLAADYGAGSDEEEEEKHEKHEAPQPAAKTQPLSEEKDDRLTDWKKMACLLCRRQFPNKETLIRHQQLSDLHKQNMEIHIKIKQSKRELEALENQEKEMNIKEASSPSEAKRRKKDTRGSGSRDSHKGNDRPGLGLEKTEKKKDSEAWNYSSYKHAVRKAMFARFKELE